ncbi:MAG: PrgI family protein [Candidatus Sungbacteria bacterium]|uniref:PrgI family protein n=1 Tax=Candidatus Sungiibacteriota bacterium TaxID=2750080 RepID=A0A932R2I9_9BACT|nr:PrgI family protein [Candidatus Sungbacteria bacterium]
MKQFQVPQFITVEDKVIGPLTIKQFLYVAAGAVIIGIAYKFLLSFLFIPVAVVVGALTGGLAFLKVNEQPFPVVVKNALLYFSKPHIYTWQQETPRKKALAAPAKKPESQIKSVPKLSESKLSDLAWSLDITERLKE